MDQLSDAERNEIFRAFAPEEYIQIYGRRIRCRLPPMLNGERRRIEMIYSLLFTLPGIPLIRYGEEIGMGDDLSLLNRDSVRTSMQWSDEPNGGFSTASSDRLSKPVISEGEYSYQQVNVATQQRDPDSLLNWFDRAIRIRKQCPEFGRGQWEILDTTESSVFAHCCKLLDKAVLAVHNFSNQSCTVTLKSNSDHSLVDLFGDHSYESLPASQSIALKPYGYRWFRVEQKSSS